MRAALAMCLLGLACASGDVVKFNNEEANELLTQIDSAFEEMALAEQQAEEAYSAEPDTVYVMDQGTGGSYRVSGMLQTFGLNGQDFSPINQMLERPRLPFFDVSWSNWVDERLQILDLFQEMVGPQPGPAHKCSHMQPESSSFDSGMVSYLASSRFGPAILTTYAQQFRDSDESDFDYETVHLPEQGEGLGKSYQEASLLDDLSANANRAFQSAEGDPRMLFQGDNVGFFGARLADNAVSRAQLEGEFESLQPSLKTPVTYFADWSGDLEDLEQESPFESEQFRGSQAPQGRVPKEADPDTSTEQACSYFLFGLLSVGCIWVWWSLARSCCTTFAEAKQRKQEHKEAANRLAQKELLAPLMPEGTKGGVEVASSYIPQGNYASTPEPPFLSGRRFVTLAVPLDQSK